MKYIFLLILILFIVDCKKLRNKIKTKDVCKLENGKCGWLYNDCCEGYYCDTPLGLGLSGHCKYEK